jgi:predicted nuclease of predicted toxin-antitoxin system
MTLAILADQCVGIPILQALEGAGFDVVRSSDVLPASAPDADVLSLAVRQQRILLTEDTDFGEMVVRMGFSALGIIRLDLEGLSRNERVERAVNALRQIGDQAKGALVTVGPKRTRIRRL